GWLDARGGPVPSNIQSLFPVWNDPSTWLLNSIAGSVIVRYCKAIGSPEMHETKHMPAAWFQDDWTIGSKLTVNAGVRYDLEVGAFAENLGLEIKPFLPPNRHADQNSNAPRCIRPDLTGIDSPYMDIPYSYQTSIGIQRQLSSTMAVTADYVQTNLKNTEIQRNVNLTYNPATGVNYPFTDLTRRAFPDWGLVNVVRFSKDGYQNDRGIQTALTKRFSRNWEMQGTYTVAWLK